MIPINQRFVELYTKLKQVTATPIDICILLAASQLKGARLILSDLLKMTYANLIASEGSLQRFAQTIKYQSASKLDYNQDVIKIITSNNIAHNCFLSTEDLGLIYQAISAHYDTVQSTKISRNKTGLFYTPHQIVDLMVSRTLDGFIKGVIPETIRKIKVLDPAIGTGTILVSVFRYLLSALQNHYNKFTAAKSDISLSEKFDIIKRSIFGVDIDSKAIEIAKMSLILEALANEQFVGGITIPDLSSNIITGNSLINSNQLGTGGLDSNFSKELQPLNWDEIFPAIFKNGGFDIIIMNPPYGLSRDQQLSSFEKNVLINAYSHFQIGKPNKYLLFMHKALELINNKGALTAIIPNSWTGIKSGESLRKKLLECGSLREIIKINKMPFEDASVEATIVRIDKSALFNTSTINSLNIESGVITQELVLKKSDWLAQPNYVIPMTSNIDSIKKCILLDEISHPLCNPIHGLTARIALQAYRKDGGTPPQTSEVVRNHPFHSKIKLDESYLPYLEGKDVGRYQIQWSGSFLSYGPWLAETQILSYFTTPRILVREIVGKGQYKVLATFTDKPFLYNRSILHILPKNENDTDFLFAVLAFINSAIFSQYLMTRGRKCQRSVFPKIVNEDLLNIPIPFALREFSKTLAALVKERLELTENKTSEIANSLDDKIEMIIETVITNSKKSIKNASSQLFVGNL